VGYDILSSDEDGSRRRIAPEATLSKNLERDLYLSGKAVEKAAALPNYHIYTEPLAKRRAGRYAT